MIGSNLLVKFQDKSSRDKLSRQIFIAICRLLNLYFKSDQHKIEVGKLLLSYLYKKLSKNYFNLYYFYKSFITGFVHVRLIQFFFGKSGKMLVFVNSNVWKFQNFLSRLLNCDFLSEQAFNFWRQNVSICQYKCLEISEFLKEMWESFLFCFK